MQVRGACGSRAGGAEDVAEVGGRELGLRDGFPGRRGGGEGGWAEGGVDVTLEAGGGGGGGESVGLV